MTKLRKAKLVEVLWEDSLMSAGWHQGRQEFMDFASDTQRVVSVGYLEYQATDRFVLSMSLRGPNRGHLLSIPASQVRMVTRLKRIPGDS